MSFDDATELWSQIHLICNAVSFRAPRRYVECPGYADVAGKPSAGSPEAPAAQRRSEQA
jgi:hypothetical protein